MFPHLSICIGDRKEDVIMSTVTIDELSKLINDYILAQAKREAERARLEAERDAKREAERARSLGQKSAG